MNHIYIGDRELDPPECDEPEACDRCGGWGWIDGDEHFSGDCHNCQGTGQVVLTDAERRQKAFDDFDPPDQYFGDQL